MLRRYSGPDSRQALSDAIARGDLPAVRKAFAGRIGLEMLSTAGLTPLMESAQSGKPAITRFLLSRGASVNACNKLGATALILAASRCWPVIVELLLRHGASADIKMTGNKTALDAAAAAGDWPSMRLLLQANPTRRPIRPNDPATPRPRRQLVG